MISDLAATEIPVIIHLMLPSYITPPSGDPSRLQAQLGSLLGIIGKRPKMPPFRLDPMIPEADREAFQNDPDASNLLGLLELAEATQADGILTSSPLLVKLRYLLRQHHRIRVIPPIEFADIVEICAHGHSLFWSSEESSRRLTFDTYYQMAHWKGKRMYNWFFRMKDTIRSDELLQSLQGLLLNRLPFLLYSRDLVLFYELQRDYFSRRGLMVRFGMAVGYYVTAFYLLLWGLLEHLTIVAKYARALSIDERKCGIKSDDFWKEFSVHDPALSAFVQTGEIAKWIGMMADMRHAAAHRVIAIPAPVMMETPESKKSDEEIRDIVRKERALLYEVLPESVIQQFEPLMIWQWRVKHMKALSESLVLIKGKTGEYLRDPVVSLDYDLERVLAVMDAFLVRLFGSLHPH